MVSIDRLVLAGAPSAARTSVSHSKPQQPMDSQQGELAWPFASGPVGMHSSPSTDRNVSIYTILLSTRFPASGEIARILIIAVSAMCSTKLLVDNEHASS